MKKRVISAIVALIIVIPLILLGGGALDSVENIKNLVYKTKIPVI